MKNNRLTNKEIEIIRDSLREMTVLESLENCSFKDKETVSLRDLKLWLMWFKVHIDEIDEIIGKEKPF